MDLQTHIPIPRSDFQVGHVTPMVLFGSCFSEHIGKRLLENKFRAEVNPFGILYNPASIAAALRRLMVRKPFTRHELVFRDGLYHSFLHHGIFSDADAEKCLEHIAARFDTAAQAVTETDVFLVTFGTAFVYRLKESGAVAGNCHKFPPETFSRTRLSVEEITQEWSELLSDVIAARPGAKFVFTVSPIRHWKDGAHENQVSKAILHLGIDYLLARFPGNASYFPAYEIVMDELRDYRFYADDMIHLSEMAVAYVWERFCGSFLSDDTRRVMQAWKPVRNALNHRPFNHSAEAYKKFLRDTSKQLDTFSRTYPFIDCEREMNSLKERMKEK